MISSTFLDYISLNFPQEDISYEVEQRRRERIGKREATGK